MHSINKKDLGLGIAAAAFGAWMLWMAAQLKTGADFWPKIVAGGIILLGVIILVCALLPGKSKEAAGKKGTPHYLGVIEVLAVLLVYYVAFQYIGYTIPTFLLISLTSAILGYRNWKVLIPTALIITVLLYLAFTKLFGINFPGVFF